MKKTILIFGLLILALLILFRLNSYTLISGGLQSEVVISIVAIVFFIIGVFINKRSNSYKEVNLKKNIDHKKIKELGLSNREYEVLQEIDLGLSNQEIASKLFVSESTIKTHVSSVLLKLNAKRRTQAIQISKALNII